jgi:hypothetical protein
VRKPRLVPVILLSITMATPVAAQPPPVDMPIRNIPQDTSVWCWAAVAQQIIDYTRGPGQSPPQCALVALAYGSPPGACCNRNPQCWVTGSLPQIQSLIGYFGGRYSALAPPADPMTLYQTLAAGRPIILFVRSGLMTSHVVVLRGMHFIPVPGGYEAVLHVNDPLGYYTQPVLFSQLVGIWMGAIVVN